jgi:hypothetical protein
MVQLSALGIVHARRRSQEAGAQVPRRLDARQGADARLLLPKGQVVSKTVWFYYKCNYGNERIWAGRV